ncbi:MAG: hypothetical protein GX091_07810 [Peptococcaceae bacterium]|nr:hypothetical protein [Peptococcaceae bacterium]
MKHDRIVLAMLLCIISFIPIEIITQIAKRLHLTNISGLEAMSMIWLPEGSIILGILAGFGIGCWHGLVVYYSTKLWGTDYFPFKSMLLAMTGQSLTFSIFGVLGRNNYLIQDVCGNYVHAFAAACSGVLLGYLFKKYLFVSRNQSNSQNSG